MHNLFSTQKKEEKKNNDSFDLPETMSELISMKKNSITYKILPDQIKSTRRSGITHIAESQIDKMHTGEKRERARRRVWQKRANQSECYYKCELCVRWAVVHTEPTPTF